jgi:hypothetical protein
MMRSSPAYSIKNLKHRHFFFYSRKHKKKLGVAFCFHISQMNLKYGSHNNMHCRLATFILLPDDDRLATGDRLSVRLHPGEALPRDGTTVQQRLPAHRGVGCQPGSSGRLLPLLLLLF